MKNFTKSFLLFFQSEFITNSLKPKLILVFSCFLFIILLSFFRLYADLEIIVRLRTIIKLDFSVLRFLFNIIILLTALKRLPELRGYRGRRYPGQLPPSKPTLQPRRLNLPPDYQWQNIGSRRTQFLDLGMQTFGRPWKIIFFSKRKMDSVSSIIVCEADLYLNVVS